MRKEDAEHVIATALKVAKADFDPGSKEELGACIYLANNGGDRNVRSTMVWLVLKDPVMKTDASASSSLGSSATSKPDSGRERAPERQSQALHRLPPLRHLLARIPTESSVPRSIKTLLTGPQLPVAGAVAVPWDIACFLESLKPKLGDHNAEFLIIPVAAKNDRANLIGLNEFPEWRNQPLVAHRNCRKRETRSGQKG